MLCKVHCSFRQKEDLFSVYSELNTSDHLCHLTAGVCSPLGCRAAATTPWALHTAHTAPSNSSKKPSSHLWVGCNTASCPVPRMPASLCLPLLVKRKLFALKQFSSLPLQGPGCTGWWDALPAAGKAAPYKYTYSLHGTALPKQLIKTAVSTI